MKSLVSFTILKKRDTIGPLSNHIQDGIHHILTILSIAQHDSLAINSVSSFARSFIETINIISYPLSLSIYCYVKA